MSRHTVQVRWQRGDQPFLDNRYSRGHTWAFDGGIEVPGSSSPHVVPLPYSMPAAVDPEEAFVASLSSCHMLWFLSIAVERGLRVDRYVDDAVGVMARNADGKLAMTVVTLRPRADFSGDRPPRATRSRRCTTPRTTPASSPIPSRPTCAASRRIPRHSFPSLPMSPVEWLVPALLALIFVFLSWLVWRTRTRPDATPELLDAIARLERELRDEVARSAAGARQDLAHTLGSVQQTLMHQGADLARTQNEQLRSLTEANDRRLAEMRAAVETKLAAIQSDNERKLEQMRATVDEKLHATLEQRLGDSFKQVAERLEQVHQGLGEMQGLARDVGALQPRADQRQDARHLRRGAARGAAGAGVHARAVRAPTSRPCPAAARGSSSRSACPAGATTARRCGCRSTPSSRARTTSACSMRRSAPTRPAVEAAGARHRDAPAARGAARSAKSTSRRRTPPTSRILFLPTEGLYAEALRRPGPGRGAAARAPRACWPARPRCWRR